MVLPDAVVEDIPDDDASSTTSMTIREKFQIPGEQYVSTGRTYEKDGYIPGWRCIRDQGRTHRRRHLFQHAPGRRVEWADAGDYPEKFSGLRLSHRAQLHHLCHDALSPARTPPKTSNHTNSPQDLLHLSASVKRRAYSARAAAIRST